MPGQGSPFGVSPSRAHARALVRACVRASLAVAIDKFPYLVLFESLVMYERRGCAPGAGPLTQCAVLCRRPFRACKFCIVYCIYRKKNLIFAVVRCHN